MNEETQKEEKKELIDTIKRIKWVTRPCNHYFHWVTKEERERLEKRFKKKFTGGALVVCIHCKEFQYTM